jgi:ADP-heptose:LPS heptosyltransferase
MNTLIVKLNATGDVVRTTCLLRRLEGSVTWVTAGSNVPLLQGLERDLRCLAWEDRDAALDQDYDLLINLEDDPEPADFARRARHARLFGAFLDDRGAMAYTEDARGWFDLSLISVHGRRQADHLKLLNRRTYQGLVFEGLGFEFRNEEYLLPAPASTDLAGDVAIAPVAGPVWPMKNWAHYADLQRELTAAGLRVNVLPRRATLQEHMGDVRNHRCLVGGDSLPMHLALGLRVPCVTLFNCTSPWEIHDYGYQTKIVSPLLAEFFYKRGMDPRATHAIRLDEVLKAIWDRLATPSHAREVAEK